MTYKVVWREEAQRAFRRLDRAVQKQVQRTADRLADNPRPGQATRLVADPGTWRILYEIRDDQLIVLVLDLGHRSEAYGGH